MRDPLDTCIVVTCGCGIRSARLLGAHSGWVSRGFVREFCGKAHSTSALRSGATASVLHLLSAREQVDRWVKSRYACSVEPESILRVNMATSSAIEMHSAVTGELWEIVVRLYDHLWCYCGALKSARIKLFSIKFNDSIL